MRNESQEMVQEMRGHGFSCDLCSERLFRRRQLKIQDEGRGSCSVSDPMGFFFFLPLVLDCDFSYLLDSENLNAHALRVPAVWR